MDKATQRRRFNIALDVMRRASTRAGYTFYLGAWIRPAGKDRGRFTREITESSAAECGTSACFSGWLMLSKEAKDEGAVATRDGLMFNNETESGGIAKFLGITTHEAMRLVYPSNYHCANVQSIKPEDVMHRLYELTDKYGVFDD
jgi:hypothetical protein